MWLCSPLSIASISINDLVLTVGINIIMLLIHDKDFFLLNDSTPVEYTFNRNLQLLFDDVFQLQGYSRQQTEFSGCCLYIFQKINKTSVVLLTLWMTLRNCDTTELICFVTRIKYQIDHRRTFPRLSKATWPVVMAMDIVAMVSYIYYGKSVVQVLSPRGKVWVWGLGLNMPSRYSGGRALSNPFV